MGAESSCCCSELCLCRVFIGINIGEHRKRPGVSNRFGCVAANCFCPYLFVYFFYKLKTYEIFLAPWTVLLLRNTHPRKLLRVDLSFIFFFFCLLVVY
jgi:hypothetical protein